MVENISHEDPDYIQATHEGVENDAENPITPTELGGRTGDARDELVEKRSEEKY